MLEVIGLLALLGAGVVTYTIVTTFIVIWHKNKEQK